MLFSVCAPQKGFRRQGKKGNEGLHVRLREISAHLKAIGRHGYNAAMCIKTSKY